MEDKIDFVNTEHVKIPSPNDYVDPIMTAPASFSAIKNEILKKGKEEEINVKPIGLFDELSNEDKEKAINLAKENLLRNDAYSVEKNLKKDKLTIPGQKYCVVSWIGPSFRAKTDKYGMRIMGAFPSLKSANLYAKKVNTYDPMYDVGVMEMNLWCLGYPDISDFVIIDGEIDQQKSQDKVDNILNDFIIRHKISIEESSQIFKLRTIAVRKSKLTTEGNIENSEIDKIPEGNYTREMEKIHQSEASKWVNNEEQEQEQEQEQEPDDKKELDQFIDMKIVNQEFAVISYVGNEGKNKRIPVSIKGVFSKQEEAEEYIVKYMKLDDTFDMLTAPLYKWILCDPNLSSIKQIYTNDELNNLLEAEENQKEESLNLHESKLTGSNLDNPLNPNYKGKGSHLNIESIEDEEEDEEYMASNLLYDLVKDTKTTSYIPKNTNDDNVVIFEKLNEQLNEKEEDDNTRSQE